MAATPTAPSPTHRPGVITAGDDVVYDADGRTGRVVEVHDDQRTEGRYVVLMDNPTGLQVFGVDELVFPDGTTPDEPCADCGRPRYYDYEATPERYRHRTEPERGCFLIEAEPAEYTRDDVEARLEFLLAAEAIVDYKLDEPEPGKAIVEFDESAEWFRFVEGSYARVMEAVNDRYHTEHRRLRRRGWVVICEHGLCAGDMGAAPADITEDITTGEDVYVIDQRHADDVLAWLYGQITDGVTSEMAKAMYGLINRRMLQLSGGDTHRWSHWCSRLGHMGNFTADDQPCGHTTPDTLTGVRCYAAWRPVNWGPRG